MSKGQRGNKEMKKPKKAPAPAAPVESAATLRAAAVVSAAPRKK